VRMPAKATARAAKMMKYRIGESARKRDNPSDLIIPARKTD
jgi:hypothetical protein